MYASDTIPVKFRRCDANITQLTLSLRPPFFTTLKTYARRGQTLSEPVVDKHTAHGEDQRLAWAVSEMQGWRLTMEDAHAHVLSLGEEGPSGSGLKTSFFAVYDGHGGSSVARFAGDTVHSRLAAGPLFKKEGETEARDFGAALKRAFMETDEDLRSNPDFRGDPSGCTAVGIIIDEKYRIICANAGDSRSVMSVGGLAEALSDDHKPTNKGENARIVAAGGFVEFSRVNGNLALSRALGDFEFKQNTNLDAEHQIVTADPDITIHEPTPEDEFVVIACDGIWDVLTSQQVIDYVRREIANRKELTTICEEIMDRCLAPDSDWGGVGCDNMTMMIVGILKGKTKTEWYDSIEKKVKEGLGEYKTPKEFVDPFAQGPRNGPTGGAGRAGPVPGSLAMALGGMRGDDDEDDGEELDLAGILRAQGLQVRGFNDDDDEADVEMVEDADADAAKIEEIPEPEKPAPAVIANGHPSLTTTSMSPP